MDAGWWQHYADEVARDFKGERWSYVPTRGVIATKGSLYPVGHGNSGSYAISMAVVAGASEIVLLGYDCKVAADGRKHWHDDYPDKMGNARSIHRWPYQFELVAKYAKSHAANVVNCSRETSLVCFKRGELAGALLATEEVI